MLKRSRRLSVNKFNKVMEGGKAYHTTFFSLRSLKVDGHSRISAVLPIKVAKTAVLRNRFKRKIYEATRPILGKISDNYNICIIAKSPLLGLKQVQIENEVKNIFVKAGVLK